MAPERAIRDERGGPRADRGAERPGRAFHRGRPRADRRAVGARGLQVDLLDPPGRARLQVWADAGQPAVRRHRRSVQEVGRRQRRRVLPVHAPVDPARTYRVRGCGATRSTSRSRSTAARATAATRSASSARRTTATSTSTPTARSRSCSGPSRPAGWDGPFIQLDPDAVVAITRDYLVDPVHGRRLEWHIEADRPAGDVARGRRRPGRAGSAPRRTWMREQAAMVPLAARRAEP